MKKLVVFILVGLLFVACSSDQIDSTTPNLIDQPSETAEIIIVEPIEEIPAVPQLSIVPFNYVLEDAGGGWNHGRVNIALANMSNEIIWFDELDLSKIQVLTEEGVIYPAELQWDRGSNWSKHSDLYLYYPSPIIPGILFSGDGLGNDNKSFSIFWRSAYTATPTRIEFPDFSELNFNLPKNFGIKANFPFISDKDKIFSVESLSEKNIPISNNNIEAIFTGFCFTELNEYSPNSYWIEFSIKNKDTFQDSQGEILIRNVMFDNDGNYFYRDDYRPVFNNNDAASSSSGNIITLGPGQNTIGAINVASEFSNDYVGNTYVALIWPNGDYLIYDMTSCPTKSDNQESENIEITEISITETPLTQVTPIETIQDSELEIFSWYTAGGEANGLAAVSQIFNKKYPGVEIINATVAGGAGSNAKAALASRLLSGNPPDSFQIHAGRELIDSWVVDDKMEPVTFLFEENGWLDVYPADLIDILSHQGEIWSVPLDIHRSNVLWYNKNIFNRYGLQPPATFEDFFDIAELLKAEGITPLALGDIGIWASTHVFENILLGTLGADGYRGLWTGDTSWDSDGVTDALNIFARMMDYVNDDHASMSWDQAAQLVIEGDAAMTIMGDWVNGYFKSVGLTPNAEFGWVPSPGTSGDFMMIADSFGLPKGAPHRSNAIAWLSVLGSREGQDAFNPFKGSIPARIDPDRSLYDEYQISAIQDYSSDEITPSVVHGAAASDEWKVAINDVMILFIADRAVTAAQAGLVQACQNAGVCQE